MYDIQIREIKNEEQHEVYAIGKRAFTGLERLWMPKPKAAFVAVVNGKIAGAVLYKFFNCGGKKVGYIDYAFIDPSFHGKGIGNELYRQSAEMLWQQGCNALTGVVKDDNVSSWGLFLKNGFKRTSIFELIKHFGIIGTLMQYFLTPLCFGVGMEYYAAVKGEEVLEKRSSSLLQLLWFFAANLFILLPAALLRGYKNFHLIAAAYASVLLYAALFDFAGTCFSRSRKWRYRFNNGGALVCALVNFASLFPMIGNWYPEKYEKTEEFKKAMGISSFCGWLALLALGGLTVFGLVNWVLSPYIAQVCVFFLLYRSIPIYPFESFGGRRVMDWNRVLYFCMALVSLSMVSAFFFLS